MSIMGQPILKNTLCNNPYMQIQETDSLKLDTCITVDVNHID